MADDDQADGPDDANLPPSDDDGPAMPDEPVAEGDAGAGDDFWADDVWMGTDEGGGSFLQNSALPWIAVIVAVLVVIGLIFAFKGGSDDGTGDAAGTTAAASEGQPTTTKANPCPHFSQGANLLGEPKVAAAPGVHVWHDIDGFHLRLVPGEGSVDEVSGTITPVGTALTIEAPKPPAATLDAGKITFALAGDAREVLFRASCSTTAVVFDLASGGAPLPAKLVSIGQGASPVAVPFTLTRGN